MLPDFQTMMLPLLTAIGEAETVSKKDVQEQIIKHFQVTPEEQLQKTPNGKQFIIYNRLTWAISYLKMADLVWYPQRGVYSLTEAGKNVLKNPPEKININFLKQFENFDKARNTERPRKNDKNQKDESENIEKTPDELIEMGYSQIINNLKDQLKQKLNECSPYFFEQVVLDLLLKMGYGGSENENGIITPKSVDEGIDGIIKEDKLGLDKIYIQAKKWEKQVGRPEIQRFVGALQGQRAKKGVFITTSEFSKESYEYAKNLDVAVILIDGNKLSQYMIENQLGITLKHSYNIFAVDSDYFLEE